MHQVGLTWDLNSFTQLVLTLFLLSFALLFFVKRTAAKYFEVGGGGGSDSDLRRDFMVPDASECSVCGNLTTKKCSRCKSVRYCSAECQRSDWNAGHKLKCKVVKSTTGLKASLFGNGSASKTALSPKLSQIIKPGDVLFPYETFFQYFNWDKPGLAPCGLTNCGNRSGVALDGR